MNHQPFKIIVHKKKKLPYLEYKHKYGGKPHTINHALLPKCENCHQNLLLTFQLDTNDPLLKMFNFSFPYLYIYWCDGCETKWLPMHYRINQDSIKIVAQGGGPKWKIFLDEYQEYNVSLQTIDEKEIKILKKEFENESGYGKYNIIGTKPIGQTNKQTVRCYNCNKKMDFFGQIDSDITEPDKYQLMFGDCGNLYIHICHDCEILATYIQTH